MIRRCLATMLLAFGASGVGPGGADAQSIQGLVSDARTANPIPAVRVTLLDAEMGTVSETRSSTIGSFSLQLPTTGVYYLSMTVDGYGALLSNPLDIPTPDNFEILVSMSPLDPTGVVSTEIGANDTDAGSADLIGRVADFESKRGVEGVSVVLLETGAKTLTDSNGYFSLPRVSQGIHLVEFAGLGMRTQLDTLLFEGGKAYQLDVTMSPEAIPIEGVTVQLRSRPLVRSLVNVQFRLNHNRHLGGQFLTRDELDFRGGQPLSQILSTLPGVEVRQLNVTDYEVRLSRTYCTNSPTMWVDGSRVASGEEPLDLNMIPTFDIEVVEVYASPASLPAEFSGASGNCGAIVIWSRRGG